MKYLSFLFAVCLFFSCGENAEDKILHEAHNIHLEAFKIKQAVSPQIEQLLQRSSGLQIQGRALTEDEIKFTTQVNNLAKKFEYWKENHLEVPGFEHEGHDHSDHDHAHDHNHASGFNFPASDMLILQKEFRDSILVIQRQAQLLLK